MYPSQASTASLVGPCLDARLNMRIHKEKGLLLLVVVVVAAATAVVVFGSL